MAKALNFLTSTIFIILLAVTTAESHSFSRKLSKKALGFKEEKITHFHFYFHDTISGNQPSAVPLVNDANKALNGFGSVFVIDDPLTMEPDINSTLVGRAQGLYAFASQQNDQALLMVYNFAFSEGIYNGSSLSLLGRNAIILEKREMPILGGTGVFRFARGYAQLTTHSFDAKTLDAVMEYDIYVSHY